MEKIIIVNFKTYEQGTANSAKELAKICSDVSKEKNIEIYSAVQLPDIRMCSEVNPNILAQHIDSIKPGANTGFVLADSVVEAGAKGTLLNHSEHKIGLDILEKSIEIAKQRGLSVIVCADTPEKAQEVAKFNPDFIAIEPPELIGGNISVSTAKPEIITNTISKVNEVASIPILCGAGIKNKDDVQKAIELGAKGILVASGVVLSEDRNKSLSDLADGFN